MEGRIIVFRTRMQEKLERFQHALKLFVERFPIIITIYRVLSWISLVVFLISLIIFKDSRTIMVQFLWSFYVILQFWLLARSKTLPWKQYITFFLVGAWIITPFTALFVNGIHLIFGGYTSDFWSTAIVTPIAEELFKLMPVLVFLFLSKRTSSFSLTDFMLMGASVGAGFQFLEETARRLQASTYFPYGHSLFGKYLNWDLFSIFPGWFELEFFPYIMTASHAVMTALMALGIGIALKLRSRLKRYAYVIPVFLYILGTLDHAAWNGDGSMPEWVESIHNLLGNGYYTKPLLLILLVGAILVDYWRLNKKRDELILLKGERIINPFSEIYQLLRTFIMDRQKFWHLMYFYRDRRELGYTLLSGNKELQNRTSDLKGIVEKHYMMLIAVAGILLITASAMTSDLLLHSSANSCFACLFDGLQSWWDRLSGVEKTAIVLMGFALSFPLLGFWSSIGVVSTATGFFSSGYQIADIIRNPKNLMSLEYAMSAMVNVGLNRIPGGKVVADELVDAGKSIRRLDKVNAEKTKLKSPHDSTKGMKKDSVEGRFTKEQLATKPLYSPIPDKWIKKGGTVKIDEDGTWVYTNKKGQTVRYPDGYPDFTEYAHPTVKPVEIEIASPTNRPMDYKKANIKAGLNKDSDPPVASLTEAPEGYTWHHHQDQKTMILVDKKVHREFTHAGGVSIVNGK